MWMVYVWLQDMTYVQRFPSFFVNKGIFGAWIVYTIDDGTLKIVVQQLYNDIVNANTLQFY